MKDKTWSNQNVYLWHVERGFTLAYDRPITRPLSANLGVSHPFVEVRVGPTESQHALPTCPESAYLPSQSPCVFDDFRRLLSTIFAISTLRAVLSQAFTKSYFLCNKSSQVRAKNCVEYIQSSSLFSKAFSNHTGSCHCVNDLHDHMDYEVFGHCIRRRALRKSWTQEM